MVSAARSSRRTVWLAVALAMTLGCASSGKKKVAAAESTFADEPPPRWESAGETAPPEKAPIPPPPATATTSPVKGAPAAPGKNGARPATPAKVGSRGAEPVKPGEPAKADGKLTPKTGPLPVPVTTTAARPGAFGKPGISDSDLLAPVLTFDGPGSKAAPPKAEPPAKAPEPPPKADPPKPEPRVDVAKAEPRSEPRPEPRAERAERSERSEDDPPARRPSEEPPRGKRPAVDDEPPPELPASAKRGDLRGTIGGKRIVFRRGVILGNRKHGYALQAFESSSASGTSRMGEVNARIEVDLLRGRLLPITLIYLQIADDGPKSDKGVRPLSCAGKGSLLLDALPPLPKKLPRREELDVGDADGALSIQVICTRDSREYGAFAIEGRLLSRVIVTPPDL